MKLSNGAYDFLNAMVRYILPAGGAMYFSLSEIWSFPYATQVVGTITIVSTFVGVVIGLARSGWKADEELIIDKSDPNEVHFGFKSGKSFEDLADETLTIDVTTIQPRRG